MKKYIIFDTYKWNHYVTIYSEKAKTYEDHIEILKSYEDKYFWNKFNKEFYELVEDENEKYEIDDTNMYINECGLICEVLNENLKDYRGRNIPKAFKIKIVGAITKK